MNNEIKLYIILIVFIFISVISYSQIEAVRNSDKIRSDTAIANVYFKKADSLSKAAQYDSTIYYYEKAGNIYQKLAAKSTVPLDKRELDEVYLKCLNNIGNNYRIKGEYNSAIEYLNQAIYYEKIYIYSNTNMENSSRLLEIAKTYLILGVVYLHKGSYVDAISCFNTSLAIKIPQLGREHPSVGATYINIGMFYNDKGDYGTAMDYYHQALRMFLKTLGKEHPFVAYSYNNIGNTYLSLGDYDRAMEYLQQAMTIKLKTLGNDHPSVARNYTNIGNVYRNKGETDKAVEYHQKSLNINLITLGNNHPSVATCYTNLGDVYSDKEDYTRAMEFQNKAMEIFKNVFGNYHPHVGLVYNSMAAIVVEQNKLDSALIFYQKAIRSLVKDFDIPNPDTVVPLYRLNIYFNPVIPTQFKTKEDRDKFLGTINSMLYLLDALVGKANTFYSRWEMENE
ncbi:MAG: tetratricopeptide repeat protein [Cytophagales bacterium]|nr:tetratricopeptide repeat protein [Cytophagales bacterium]